MRSRGYVLPRHAFDLMRAGLRPVAFRLLRRLGQTLAGNLRLLLSEVVEVLSAQGTHDGISRPEAADEIAEISMESVDVGYLRSLPALAGLTETELRRFLGYGRAVEIERGSVAGGQDPVRSCLLIVGGAIQPRLARRDGGLKLPLLGPGAIFGAMPLLDGRPPIATAVAREKTTVVEVRGERLLQEGESLGFKWLELLIAALLDDIRRTTLRYAWLQAEGRWGRRRDPDRRSAPGRSLRAVKPAPDGRGGA